jgi:hypothetical protein
MHIHRYVHKHMYMHKPLHSTSKFCRRLLSVEPSQALALQNGKKLALQLTFSKEIGSARGGREMEGRIQCDSQAKREFFCEHAVFLYAATQEEGGTKVPEIVPAYIDRMSERVLRVTFSSSNMVPGRRYLLHIQQNYFRSVDGTDVDVEAHHGAHEYAVASSSCDCNGRGECDAQGTCACTAGYTGTRCDQCAEGYTQKKVGLQLVQQHHSCDSAKILRARPSFNYPWFKLG